MKVAAVFNRTLQGHLLLALVLLVQNIFCEKLVEIKVRTNFIAGERTLNSLEIIQQ